MIDAPQTGAIKSADSGFPDSAIPGAEPAITASGLGRDFAKTQVLYNVNLALAKGSVCALLGRNGAGKTTLLKLLMGLIEPTRGHAQMLNHSCWPPVRAAVSRTGCLLDGFEPPSSTRIRHLMALSDAVGPAFDAVRAGQLLTSHGLERSRTWSSLSKGQRRWVLLVFLLCRGCDVLLLDEPADGLDPQTRIELYQLIRQEANNRDITVLVATHVLSDIERVVDRVCILNKHSILLASDLEELREQLWIMECDPAPAATSLPTGVELVKGGAATAAEGGVMVLDPTGVLSSQELPNEIRRRRATLEEFFLAVTSP